MADQKVTNLLYLGPAPDDESNVVVTVELTCGCRVTRVVHKRRVCADRSGGYTIAGRVPCPVGHPAPAWQDDHEPMWLISHALGRT
ncbi:MAG: hypothetical protein AAGF11_22925 [Myxococcota bacterium]